MKKKLKKILKNILKIILWIIFFIAVAFIALMLSIWIIAGPGHLYV